MILILFKIMFIFDNKSADFAENDHNLEQNEDRATVILKSTDFSNINIIYLKIAKMDAA